VVAIIACGAPSSPPESLPTLEHAPGEAWQCYRIETDARVSGCYRSVERCRAIQTEMAKQATATECAPQDEAACFSYWSETESRPLESCAATLDSCQARRTVQLRVAAGDTRQPTECEMWPSS
jgi:hypothetical protein